jgi:hypothetical protein
VWALLEEEHLLQDVPDDLWVFGQQASEVIDRRIDEADPCSRFTAPGHRERISDLDSGVCAELGFQLCPVEAECCDYLVEVGSTAGVGGESGEDQSGGAKIGFELVELGESLRADDDGGGLAATVDCDQPPAFGFANESCHAELARFGDRQGRGVLCDIHARKYIDSYTECKPVYGEEWWAGSSRGADRLAPASAAVIDTVSRMNLVGALRVAARWALAQIRRSP